MLDLRRLRLLRELHDRGTIAAVADALQFTPSAISQQLAQLERETGVRLLQRAGREHQSPEERGGEHEASGEERPHRGALLVGELAEDPHGAERGGGGEAEKGSRSGHGRIVKGKPPTIDIDW